ncbi:family 16 glycosylhydrolase (plasmid) [Skermanella sp. TT6]|uniref:Family 16 glycosylhydrolase n=1 Tax=Skermanella cutis TaxID=2775420 RepID=A0ABX7BEC8_9PROT|nr:family 16 glycosylhydrolase [Skermanella sp. TT6]QQP92758.1 family 16 glycosylhydrolase [Skermanella sp. TT6]
MEKIFGSTKYNLLFQENFDAFSWHNGTSGIWSTTFDERFGARSLPSGELQTYVEPTYRGYTEAPLGLDPFDVSNGVLTISAKPVDRATSASLGGASYTSGLITTEYSFQQTYGYFEMRADMPAGSGFWPAFWLLPIDHSWSHEIDVMEVLTARPNNLEINLHAPDSAQQYSRSVTTTDLTAGFHTYGLEWTAKTLTWYLDGVAVGATSTPSGMDKPMYLLANLAVGGAWGGNPDLSTPFPAEMKIDYIRAWASDAAGPILPQAAPLTLQPAKPISAPAIPALTISGDQANNILNGTAKGELINGKDGDDRMSGGGGDDTYVVGQAGDTVMENAIGGNDTVRSSLYSYQLPANVENLKLIGNAVIGIGNDLANRFEGNGKDNQLDGGGGDDYLYGGDGNDTFVIRRGEGNDTISKFAAGDVVKLEGFGALTSQSLQQAMWQDGASARVMLDNGQVLTFLYTNVQSLTEKSFEFIRYLPQSETPMNWVVGTKGHETLTGTAGHDAFYAYSGNNVFVGGKGDDSYSVADQGDYVVEKAGEGIDTIKAWGDYTLSKNVENLYLQNTTFKGIGNELDNIISGNSAANVLEGGRGDDMLHGVGGDDLFIYRKGDGHDTIMDFDPSSKSHVELHGFGFTKGDQVIAHLRPHGGDTNLVLGDEGVITFVGVQTGAFHADDFTFA